MEIAPPAALRTQIGPFSELSDWVHFMIWGFCLLKDGYNLKSEYNVLDLGCGPGRLALPFKMFLTKGSYYGFDVNRQFIDWCNRAWECDNIHFVWGDIYNSEYAQLGRIKDYDYTFPDLPEDYFNFIFANSLFTHMVVPGIGNYLSHMNRLLKMNGEFMFTAFLMNDQSRATVSSNNPFFKFPIKVDNAIWANYAHAIEAAVGIEEHWLTHQLAERGFELKSIRYGDWPTCPHAGIRQDEILITKVRNIW